MTTNPPTPLDDQLLLLQSHLKQLENEALPIEKALALYEASMALIKSCQSELCNIEQKVSVYQQGELKPLHEDSL
jgi:exodeoxyribonuclease VII small subunit